MKNFISLGLLLVVFLSACSSGQKKRAQERDSLVQSKKVFCDFVSESDTPDVDVELNLRIAKRCDASRPFSITAYKRVSENPGVLFCCGTATDATAPSSSAVESVGETESTEKASSNSKK